MAIQSRPCERGKKIKILEIKFVLLQGALKSNIIVLGRKHMARSIE
jgi:hypothetical protein